MSIQEVADFLGVSRRTIDKLSKIDGLPGIPINVDGDFRLSHDFDAGEMSVREVADFLNIKKFTVYRLLRQGVLPGKKRKGIWRIKVKDLREWVKAQSRKIA